MGSSILSNKGGDTNFPIEYDSISCWLVFCSSACLEEKFGTSPWCSRDLGNIYSFQVSLQYLISAPKEIIENLFIE